MNSEVPSGRKLNRPRFDIEETNQHCEHLGLNPPTAHLREINLNNQGDIHQLPGRKPITKPEELQSIGYHLSGAPFYGREDWMINKLQHDVTEWVKLSRPAALTWLDEMQVQGISESTIIFHTWGLDSIPNTQLQAGEDVSLEWGISKLEDLSCSVCRCGNSRVNSPHNVPDWLEVA